MPQLAYITRGNASPQGKPRVYFCCHPADQAAFLQPMAKELLALVDCSVWYDPEPATPLSPEERSSREAGILRRQARSGQRSAPVRPWSENLLSLP